VPESSQFLGSTAGLFVTMMTRESKASNSLLLEMRQIDKSFPGVQALKRVSTKLCRWEVLSMEIA